VTFESRTKLKRSKCAREEGKVTKHKGDAAITNIKRRKRITKQQGHVSWSLGLGVRAYEVMPAPKCMFFAQRR
jgi:hypothetical protein